MVWSALELLVKAGRAAAAAGRGRFSRRGPTCAAAVAVIALALAACSSIRSAPSTEPADAGAASGERDGAGSLSDAGIAADAAGAGFCATRVPAPRFCDDFDDGDLVDDWDVPTAFNGEPILDTFAATSRPASFALETIPLLAGEGAHVHLRTTVKGSPDPARGHVVFSFSLMLGRPSFERGVIGIAPLDLSPSHFFTLNLRDGDETAPAATLAETAAGVSTRHVLTTLPDTTTWRRVTIDVDVAASRVVVTWGERTVLDAPIAATPVIDPTIRLGAIYMSGPADALEARFDDVTLDF